jgi:hypothetical protein
MRFRLRLSSLAPLVSAMVVLAAVFCVCNAAGLAVALAAGRGSDKPLSVTLGEGRLGMYGWRSELRSAGKLQEEEPGSLCINTLVIEQAEGSELENCGPVLRRGVSETSRGGTREKPITVFTVIFKVPVQRMYLKLLGHRGHTVALRQIGVKRLKSISTVPLSTFAEAFGGPFCLERYVAFDGQGKAVADSGHHRCSRGS